jgi:acetolactate synthase-1/2/3 large subunit
MLASDHTFNAGTFGSHGTRSGNFIMQNADFVLSIGSRLSTRETGSPISDWARGAKVAVVDIDEAELNKFEAFGRPIDIRIKADAGAFLDALMKKKLAPVGNSDWKQRIVDWRAKYKDAPRLIQTTKVDPYDFIVTLTRKAPDDSHMFTDTGCSVAWLMQAGELKLGQRTYHDFNNTAMGWGLPAAIGGAFATSGETICITGDGSLMMNVQEFATAVAHQLPVKTILMDNSGYSMVRQTEEQWLDGVNVGTSVGSGLAFPDWCKLGDSFGLPVKRLETSEKVSEAIDWLLAQRGPALLIVDIDPAERVVPQVAFGYPLEDAEPHLPREEFLEQMIVEPLAVSLTNTDPGKTL